MSPPVPSAETALPYLQRRRHCNQLHFTKAQRGMNLELLGGCKAQPGAAGRIAQRAVNDRALGVMK